MHLDYKAAGALGKTDGKKKEIAKDVSAFANSDGGVIIYGVSEYNDKEKEHLPEKLDPIDRTEFSKEWLEHVINNGITPKINELKIHPIALDSDVKDAIYVVEIPKGNTAHQAIKEKRYFKRYNFESVAMDDWELKDVINRIQKTKVRIEFKPVLKKSILDSLLNKMGANTPIEFRVIANNEGNKLVEYLECFLHVGIESKDGIIEPKPTLYKTFVEIMFSTEVERRIELEGKEIPINTERFVILPRTYRELGTLKVHPQLIRNNPIVELQVSTEDSSEFINIYLQDYMS